MFAFLFCCCVFNLFGPKTVISHAILQFCNSFQNVLSFSIQSTICDQLFKVIGTLFDTKKFSILEKRHTCIIITLLGSNYPYAHDKTALFRVPLMR